MQKKPKHWLFELLRLKEPLQTSFIHFLFKLMIFKDFKEELLIECSLKYKEVDMEDPTQFRNILFQLIQNNPDIVEKLCKSKMMVLYHPLAEEFNF